jgi:hypothetical protein
MATALGEALAATRSWGNSSSSRVSPTGEVVGPSCGGGQRALGGDRVGKSNGAGGSKRDTGDGLVGVGGGTVHRPASLESSGVWRTNNVSAGHGCVLAWYVWSH